MSTNLSTNAGPAPEQFSPVASPAGRGRWPLLGVLAGVRHQRDVREECKAGTLCGCMEEQGGP